MVSRVMEPQLDTGWRGVHAGTMKRFLEVPWVLLMTSLLTSGHVSGLVTGTGNTMVMHGRHVNKCKPGFGYPDFCPLPDDPNNRTRCCRNLDKPRCCDERASRVCMRPAGAKKAGTNIDPDPAHDAIFCPGPRDPDYYDVCCWRKYSTHCCSRYITPQIFGGVFGSLAVASVLGVLGICLLKRKGSVIMVKSREDMRSQKAASGPGRT